MAELNLKQITDRLNAEFTGDTRKLVFWYDDKGEFAEDIDSIELENAKIYHLAPDNQFYTKYFLERQDRTTNYLIYAPFPKPDVKENHLEDTMLYSKRFFADRASLLSLDLGIEEKYKPVIEKYIKFFANKDRTKWFYDLEIENFNEENILTGLLSSLCKTRTCSFEEVLRVVLMENVNSAEKEDGTDQDLSSQDGKEKDNNSFLMEFARYDLEAEFWKLCEEHFGYQDADPTLEKLLFTLFVTYTERFLGAGLPVAWKPFVSYKPGNVIAFLDNLRNNILYRDRCDKLAEQTAKSLGVAEMIRNNLPEEVLDCDSFEDFDKKILNWMMEQLLEENTGAKLQAFSIPEICEKRKKMHYGEKFRLSYQLMQSAYQLIMAVTYQAPVGFKAIVEQYTSQDYRFDQEYRRFIACLDQMENADAFENLRELIENIYANEYLTKLLPKWNEAYHEPDLQYQFVMQRDFYSRRLNGAKEQTVVIISDALRYEVAEELAQKMQDDPKCDSAKLSPMISTLPSYTRLGMAALLPHKSLTMTEDYEVLADGVLCNDLNSRQSVLQSHQPDSLCFQFDDIKNKKVSELRQLLAGKQIVYIYHNQIDARGDKTNTEDEVFSACTEAISEIIELIHRLNSANKQNFIVTADHGFLYRRNKLNESDKIDTNRKNGWVNRRFIIAPEAVEESGIDHVSLGSTLENDDKRVVSYPVGMDVFKAGGGLNYVHGGSSPQEMLIPLLDLHMEKGKIPVTTAEITLVSLVQKITNLITSLDFIQSEAVSDTIRAGSYKLYFASEDGEKISNENVHMADSRETEDAKRIFRVKFTFKNRQYSRNKKYYLVAINEATGVESWRHEIIMDLAFGGDFGFGF
ncbi:BREX-1 system phosphatase PglZ type A [Brotaphodocola sp.]|uniref:BREX-1 system phosphatase PglZ type A n=1 Tax=Brotaphodocola sp. TaxID=3073577 RepID=UPI003D7D58A1